MSYATRKWKASGKEVGVSLLVAKRNLRGVVTFYLRSLSGASYLSDVGRTVRD